MTQNMTNKERRDMIIYLTRTYTTGSRLIWSHESIYLSQNASYKRMRHIANLRVRIARDNMTRYELAQKLSYQDI